MPTLRDIKEFSWKCSDLWLSLFIIFAPPLAFIIGATVFILAVITFLS